jgi:hypothetical protein
MTWGFTTTFVRFGQLIRKSNIRIVITTTFVRQLFKIVFSYERQTIFALIRCKVCSCRTRIDVGYRHNTNTYNYNDLCHFLKLLLVSICQLNSSTTPFESRGDTTCLKFISFTKNNWMTTMEDKLAKLYLYLENT